MSKKKKLSPYKIAKTLDGYVEAEDECGVVSNNTKRYVESKEERDQRMKHNHANRSTKHESKDAECGGILVESSPKKKT